MGMEISTIFLQSIGDSVESTCDVNEPEIVNLSYLVGFSRISGLRGLLETTEGLTIYNALRQYGFCSE
jgi:hypothetical protein